MGVLTCLLLALGGCPAPHAASDTLRLEVGSAAVDGRIMRPHYARNRVYRGEGGVPVTHWTNELTLGDSAGLPVMRWVTRGQQGPPGSDGPTWELLQTYHARTLAPLAYSRTSSTGAYTRLTFGGNRVRGVRRVSPDSAETEVTLDLDRPGFMAGASDLVPYAVGLRGGLVMTAPVWAPGMRAAEGRIFSVLAQETVTVEGERVTAWKVEERTEDGGNLVATWWLTNESPYMVYAEVVLPNGQIQRMTGVDLGGAPRP